MFEKSTDNYTSDGPNCEEWCQNCVHYGEHHSTPYWLCLENVWNISEIAFSGHCDKFSDTKEINLLKRCLLKIEGFKLKNKVR